MKDETYLSTTISSVGDGDAKSNAHALKLLADKQILARIMKRLIPDFFEMTVAEIIECISAVDIQTKPVEPGRSNLGPVPLQETVDNVQNEGVLYYDIRFAARTRLEDIRILLNVEAQNTTDFSKLGYHISNRIVFYMCRMVSAQKNVEFFHSDYDKLKRVYSIWICFNNIISKGAIEELHLECGLIYGTQTGLLENNLLHGMIVSVPASGECDEEVDELVRLLNDLFRREAGERKKKILTDRYQLEMNADMEREVNDMFNLRELYQEQDREEGRKEGIELGMAQGIEQGMMTIIQSFVMNSHDQGMTKETVEGNMITLLSLSPEEAHHYIQVFWE